MTWRSGAAAIGTSVGSTFFAGPRASDLGRAIGEGRSGWDVVKEASGTPISHHRMKDLAIESAVAKATQAELGVARVKRVDGTIQHERSYEKRPSPPNG